MFTMLKDWAGPIEVNGVRYTSVKDVLSVKFDENTPVTVKLLTKTEIPENRPISTPQRIVPKSDEVRVAVKQYMTKKSSPEFDFMERWNGNRPMPLRTMVGVAEKETRGMVYMKLHGDIYAERICTCMKCGRALTNPVSQYFGIGPECGGHNYVNPFNSEEELRAAVSSYRKELQNVTWEGWIIKSAILEKEAVQ